MLICNKVILSADLMFGKIRLDKKKRESWISSDAGQGSEFLNPPSEDNSRDPSGIEEPTLMPSGSCTYDVSTHEGK